MSAPVAKLEIDGNHIEVAVRAAEQGPLRGCDRRCAARHRVVHEEPLR